ncbi:MAG TPA: AraC family transcriptional regulator [Opitutae bacterium]|nr:AraC family transcriptional regulator [Coraliomargarita sp.]HBO58271.1 AraC family transcriptional regulator [Opitutae bacterium]|tara:strand:+ start:7378 stop:8610 length:1233 start_codon:yes stop_codon:yes gene_type:complete
MSGKVSIKHLNRPPGKIIPEVAIVTPLRWGDSQLILKGISAYLKLNHPWRLFLDDQSISSENPEFLSSRNLHGIISRTTTEALVDYCSKRSIPLIDLNDSKSWEGVPKSIFDNVGMGHMGAEYLLGKGSRTFAFCGFSNQNWSTSRRDGFVECMQLCHRAYTIHEVEYDEKVLGEWLEAQEHLLGEWIQSLPKPAAVLCCNDYRAVHLLNACIRASITVPEEVIILGLNNEVARCEISTPQLSSVDPNAERVGFTAAKMLDQLMQGQALQTDCEVADPLGVVERRSTDFCSVEDPRVAKALNYIFEHATHGISVDNVCKAANASRSFLERRFRKLLNRSPQVQIRMIQIERAKQLLRETDYTLNEIAERLGFEHPEYLSVVFKRMTGDSPGAYRKKNGIMRKDHLVSISS